MRHERSQTISSQWAPFQISSMMIKQGFTVTAVAKFHKLIPTFRVESCDLRMDPFHLSSILIIINSSFKMKQMRVLVVNIIIIIMMIISTPFKMVQKMVSVVTCRTSCFTLPTQFALQCNTLQCNILHCTVALKNNIPLLY